MFGLSRLYNWFFADQYTTAVNEMLDEAIAGAQLAPLDKREMFESSLKYLQRSDVRSQAAQYCRDLEARQIDTQWHSMLQLAYLELVVRSNKDESWVLNFWPCADCACVGFERKKE